MRREDSPWWSAGYTREWWKALSDEGRQQFLEAITDEQAESFLKDWRVWARDSQLAPEGAWGTWLLLAGRGFGKTRTAVEHIIDVKNAGVAGSICLLGQGEDDVRDIMIEGDSGFLRSSPSWDRPRWLPSRGGGKLIWDNGAVGHVYSAADPEALRGPNFDYAWCDEPMAFPADAREKAISNMRFGLRIGRNPRLVYTTTPKPHRWLKALLKKAGVDKAHPNGRRETGIVITRGNTYENRENLSEVFFDNVVSDYEGTSLGRQELHAEVLGDEEGALWTPALLDAKRLRDADPKTVANSCERVAVGVDPNIKTNGTAHAAGVVVAGRRGDKRFCIADYTQAGGPAMWAKRTVDAYQEFKADVVTAEGNQGGEMVRMVIKQEAAQRGLDIAVILTHSSRGKQRRAEPVAQAYQQGTAVQVGEVGYKEKPGPMWALEEQMCALHEGLDPTGEDFDRVDALVSAMTHLASRGSARVGGSGFYRMSELTGVE